MTVSLGRRHSLSSQVIICYNMSIIRIGNLAYLRRPGFHYFNCLRVSLIINVEHRPFVVTDKHMFTQKLSGSVQLESTT